MSDVEKVRELIEQFAKLHLRARPRIKWPYDLVKDKGKPWPNGWWSGCYAYFNENYELLYIGKALFISDRLYAHSKDTEKMKEWGARYALTVGIEDEENYQVPALELFLIRKLNPPRNISEKDYDKSKNREVLRRNPDLLLN